MHIFFFFKGMSLSNESTRATVFWLVAGRCPIPLVVVFFFTFRDVNVITFIQCQPKITLFVLCTFFAIFPRPFWESPDTIWTYEQITPVSSTFFPNSVFSTNHYNVHSVTRYSVLNFDLRLPPLRKLDFRSSGMLRSVYWYFATDVSGQPMLDFWIWDR